MDLNEAASSLEGLFTDEPVAEPTKLEEIEVDEPEETEADAVQDEEGEGTDEEPEEGEADEGADEDAEDPKGRKYLTLLGADGKPKRVHIDALLADTLHDIPVEGGKKEWVSYKELKEGHMRMRDYTRKTMAVADVEAKLTPHLETVARIETDPGFQEYVQDYIENQGVPRWLVAATRPDVSEAQLVAALEKGDEALKKEALSVMRARSEMRELQAQSKAHVEELKTAREEHAKRLYEAEMKKLAVALPEFKTEAKRIKSSLASYGYSENEIPLITDHRILVMARDAAIGRQTLGRDTGKPKVAPAPRAPKASRQRTSPKTGEAKRKEALYSKAKASQSLDDWAKALEGIL